MGVMRLTQFGFEVDFAKATGEAKVIQPQREPEYRRIDPPAHVLCVGSSGFDRNGWPTSVGIGGRIASESVAGLHRITHYAVGIRKPATRLDPTRLSLADIVSRNLRLIDVLAYNTEWSGRTAWTRS
jgi:hypothetical protein